MARQQSFCDRQLRTRASTCGLALLLSVSACAQAGRAAQPAAEPSAEDKRKAMEADVNRLLGLAQQLKVEVDKSRKDELSLKVIRDADEIDKLARSARGRIR